MNEAVDGIFNYKPDTNEDYYLILGCDELSSKEQIKAEYKARVLHCHPDKFPNDPVKAAEFERIQTARDVLCDDEKRANYDKWRHAGITLSFKKWCNMRGAVHTSMHWMTPKKETMIQGSDTVSNVELQSNYNQPLHTSSSHISDTRISRSDNDKIRTPWQREQPSEMLKKFRNYEI
ncbi:DnaJ subfamily C member 12 [Mactra antiquata]